MITPRRIRRRITPKIQIQPLDLLDMPLPPQHRHAVRLVQRRLSRPHLSVEEARRHNVHAGELAPLAGQRLAEVVDEGLGGVVNGLVYGDVDNVGAHARGDDEVAEALSLEDLAGVLAAVDDSINWVVLVEWRAGGRGGGAYR